MTNKGIAVVIACADVPDDILRIALAGMAFNVPDTEAVRIALASRSYELHGAELQIASTYVVADKRESE